MTASEFVEFWKDRKDTDGTNAVGIGVSWPNVVVENCAVDQYFGNDAWEKIGQYWAPYWGNFKRTTMGEWLDQSRADYQKFIDEEKTKIEFYNDNGLVYPYFCAFADKTGSIGSLGDGCHRYIDCNYLMLKKKDLSKDIEKCRLDVLRVPNLSLVLSENDIPPTYKQL